jgi:hypothetical protein
LWLKVAPDRAQGGLMSIFETLAPVFVQVILTFVLLFWMAYLRVAAVRSGEAKPRDVALRQPNWPLRVTQVANAYQNQLELPLLFYLLVVLLMLTRNVSATDVLLAWIFVILRIVHVAIHVASNHLLHRFLAFAAGSVVLAIMWGAFIWRITRVV